MKTRIFLLSLALASVMLSCTDKLSEQLMWDEGVMATIPGYEDADGTRVSFVNGLGNFRWSNGDCIGVCRSSSSSNGTAAFTLLKGGESVGNFIFIEECFKGKQIQSDFFLNNIYTRTCRKRRILIHHIGIKAITGVSSHSGCFIKMIEL